MTINQKIYISIASFVFLAAIFIAFLVYPSFSAIKKSSLELPQEKEKIALLNREAESREKTEALFRKYQQDFETIEKLFVDPDVPLELISFLENTSLNSNAQLTISSLTKRAQMGDPWPSLILELSVTGSPSNFLEFLEKVESAPFLIEVLNLTLRDTLAIMTVKVFTR